MLNKTKNFNMKTIVDLWLILVDVWQRPIQHCNAIIFQFKRKKKKSNSGHKTPGSESLG